MPAVSSPSRHAATRHRAPAAATPPGTHPGQPVLLRGGQAAQAAHPAVHRLRDPPPPAPAGLRHLPVLRLGHASRPRAGAPSTASWSTTTRRSPPSTTRWWSPWSSWRRAPAWWPTSSGITPETVAIGMAVEAGFEDFDDDLSLPVFHPAGTSDATEDELMDFTFNEEQPAVREAADGIFAGLVTPDRVAARSRPPRTGSTGSCGPSWPRPTCWAWPSPRPDGGGGYGMVELCHPPRGPGQGGGPRPAVGHAGAGGPARRRVRLRRPAVRAAPPGDRRRRPPHRRPGRRGRRHRRRAAPARPPVSRADGRRRHRCACPGTAIAVPYAHVADRVLVPAGRRRTAWSWPSVDPSADGVTARAGRSPPTARSTPTSTSTG